VFKERSHACVLNKLVFLIVKFVTKTETDTSMDRDTDMDADTDTDKETDDDYQQHQEGGATEYLAPNKWCYKFAAKF
jgi:hypothetical protein